MRKLYDEYFYIPEGGKIREKVMLARVATMVVIVVLCLVAMGFTAYAYFSADLTSGSNRIVAASFDIDVTVDGNAVTERSGKAYVASLPAGEHTVMLKHAENSTATTGFVVITATDCDTTYHTAQIGKNETLTFTITANADTIVSFLVHWGTSSDYGHDNEGVIHDEDIINVNSELQEELTPDDEQNDMTETANPTEPEESAVPEPSQPAAPTEPNPAGTSESEDSPAAPGEPEPSEPEPGEPEIGEPESGETEPDEPEISEPELDEPEPSESTPGEPDPSEPEISESEPSGEELTEQSEPVTEDPGDVDEPAAETGE